MDRLTRLPILEFIKRFKNGFNENALIAAFTEGNCYHFAIILKNIYCEGRIIYSQRAGHFMFKLNEKYYDITGEVKAEDAMYFDTMYFEDPLLYNILMRDCVLRIDYYPGVENKYCTLLNYTS